MRIAITGKGGVGKTTLAGSLARTLANEGFRVLALDVDSNPNLAYSLGIPREQANDPERVPRGLTEWRTGQEGQNYVALKQPVAEFISDYAIPAPGGVNLLVMGEVIEASIGCRCEEHAVARGLAHHLSSEADLALLDMEAGLEHLGRGTAEDADLMLIVVEPYYRSLMAATRIQELAEQLGIPRIYAVANRVRSPKEAEAVQKYCREHNLELLAVIPFDEAVIEAEEQDRAPIDFAPACASMMAVAQLARELRHRIG